MPTRDSFFHVLLLENKENDLVMIREWLDKHVQIKVYRYRDIPLKSKEFNPDNLDLIITRVDSNIERNINLIRIEKMTNRHALILFVSLQGNTPGQEKIISFSNGFLLTPIDKDMFLIRVLEMVSQAKKLREKKCILAIGAHPDDVEIGCGGALSKHVEQGAKLVILTLCHGSSGGDGLTRIQEAKIAAEFIGATLYTGGFTDTHISEGPETIEKIQEIIQTFQPTHIYTHSSNDDHQDHRNTYHASMVAARKIHNVYCYQSPSTTVYFRPHRFINITNFIHPKLKAISAYKSQIAQRAYLNPDLIRATARYWGRFAGYMLSEPMEVIRENDV